MDRIREQTHTDRKFLVYFIPAHVYWTTKMSTSITLKPTSPHVQQASTLAKLGYVVLLFIISKGTTVYRQIKS